MMKHPSFLLAPVALIAFGAGWWLRPMLPLGQDKTILSVVSSRGESAAPAPATAVVKPVEAPTAPGTAAPFRSWAEIMSFLADGSLEEDPVLAQEGIARLLNTGASDLETILGQSVLSNHSNRGVNGSLEMARSVLLFRWSMLAPAQAASFALSHPESEEFKAMAPYFIANLARANPDLAESLIAKLPEDERSEAATELQFARAAADPAAFLQDPGKRDLLAEDPDLERRVFSAWVKKSPSEAAAWFQSLPPEKQTDSLGEGLMRTWMSREPTAAMAWLQALPNAEAKAEMGKSYGSTLVNSMSPEAFAGVLEKLPSDVAEHVLGGAIADWPDASAPTTKSFLLKWLATHPEGTEGASMAAGLLYAAFQSDASGQKALQFLQELPPGPTHDQSIETIAETWSEKDPEAASKWVTSLPEGSPGRDLAAHKLVQKIQDDDPEGAMLWALSIQKAESKQEALKDVFENWLPQDPYGALKALGTLPAEMQESLGYKR